mmetsp:Transcript_27535/g.58072  ORF Transcript_27535/g.58072 Transcript_27535/m.58072 type:complete len:80 (+) Transcript_27535:2776-3015(+)
MLDFYDRFSSKSLPKTFPPMKTFQCLNIFHSSRKYFVVGLQSLEVGQSWSCIPLALTERRRPSDVNKIPQSSQSNLGDY